MARNYYFGDTSLYLLKRKTEDLIFTLYKKKYLCYYIQYKKHHTICKQTKHNVCVLFLSHQTNKETKKGEKNENKKTKQQQNEQYEVIKVIMCFLYFFLNLFSKCSSHMSEALFNSCNNY